MSKFRRVSEKEQLPEYLDKAFNENYAPDPYAHLKQSSTERRQVIAKNAKDYKMSRADTPKDWERLLKQEDYQNFEFPRNEAELRANTLGSSNRIVKKSEYLNEEPLTARTLEGQLKPFSDEQYMHAMLKGASIWEPDMEDIKDAFKASQIKEDEMSKSEALEMMRQKRHAEWESEAMSQVKSSVYATSRAKPIIKTSMEIPVDMNHGSINWNAVDASDRQRLEMRENRRKSTLEIKMAGTSREEIHKAWEDDLNPEAQTLQSYYASNGIDLDLG